MKRALLMALLCTSPLEAITCGNTTAGGGTDTGDANIAGGPTCTTGSNTTGYTVSSCSANLGTVTSGHIKCAIYNSGATAKLCESASVTAVASQVNTISLSGCGTLAANTTYDIVFGTDDNSVVWNCATNPCNSGATNTHWDNITYPTFPASLAQTSNFNYTYYITISSSVVPQSLWMGFP